MDNQQLQQEQKPMKKNKTKVWIFLIILIIVIAIIGATTGGDDETNTNSSPANKVVNTNTVVEPLGDLLDYEIIEEDDISYAGCERVGIHITVPEDATQEDINFTMEYIIDDYLFWWDDVTVWVDNTGDMDEWSDCD